MRAALLVCALACRPRPMASLSNPAVVSAPTFPSGHVAARWLAEGAVSLGGPRTLGPHQVWLSAGLARPGAPCDALPLPPQVRVGDHWQDVPWPAEGVTLELSVDIDVIRSVSASATLTAPRGPRALWRLRLLPPLVVSDVVVDGAPAAFAHEGEDLIVALPAGPSDDDVTVAVHFAGSVADTPAVVLGRDIGIMGFALLWTPTLGQVHGTFTGLPDRSWFGPTLDPDQTPGIVAGTWSLGTNWVLQGPGDVLNPTGSGPFILWASGHLTERDRLLARAQATLSISRALGLPDPPTELLASPHRFSHAGPPILLGDYVFTEPVWEHVVSHEMGHAWFARDGIIGEAGSAWVATWVDDPDGTPATFHYLPSLGPQPRCTLFDPHLGDFDLDTHGAGLLLVALEDRIGRAAVLHALLGAVDWGQVLAKVPSPDQAWFEAWLRADRWPNLALIVDENSVALIDRNNTGLTGTVEVDVDGFDGHQTLVVPFGPDASSVPLPPGSQNLVPDPRARAPVVLDR